MSTTSVFNIRQGPLESLRNYLARFYKAIIKIVTPNQEMQVGAFQNGLKEGHFNESLNHNLALSLEEVVTKVECYIKGKEINA